MVLFSVLCCTISCYFSYLHPHLASCHTSDPIPTLWLATIFDAVEPSFLSFLLWELRVNVALSGWAFRCHIHKYMCKGDALFTVFTNMLQQNRKRCFVISHGKLADFLLHFQSDGCAAVFCGPPPKSPYFSLGNTVISWDFVVFLTEDYKMSEQFNRGDQYCIKQ